MKMHYAHKLSGGRIAQIVGMFVLVPLLGLLAAGIFKAEAEHVFEEKYRLHAMVHHSHGLGPGAAMLVSGIPIGKVDAVEFTEDGTIDVTLLLLRKYQDKVREDSEASVTSSGLFVGQPQVEIAGQVLAEIEQSARALPEVMASIQRAVGSVERTTTALPELTDSVRKTLATVEGATGDVRAATRRLPGLVEAAQEAVNNVKSTTQSLKGISKDLLPIVQGAHETLDDVNTIVRGAKKTFPVSAFVKNAEPKAPSRSESGLRSLRGDELGR